MSKRARRYARAFSHVFADTLSPEFIAAIHELCTFFRDHHRLAFFLKLSVIDDTVKIDGLQALFERFGLKSEQEPLNALVTLLRKRGRLALLPQVLCFIQEYYERQRSITSLSVSSAHELSQEERETVRAFIQKQIGGTVRCSYRVDPELIAGIRIQGCEYGWEWSVARQLREMRVAIGVH